MAHVRDQRDPQPGDGVHGQSAQEQCVGVSASHEQQIADIQRGRLLHLIT
ncbi:MAG: hypothetical protein MK074_09935 [Phycisphaerales bacterium]|nr:hypothetical protein [Phycisphaerales bacterium]